MCKFKFLNSSARKAFTICFVSFTSVILFLNASFAQPYGVGKTYADYGDTVTYRGNTFELPPSRYDTMYVTDPGIEKEVPVIRRMINDCPLTVNGAKIYHANEVSALPEFSDSKVKADTYILHHIQKMVKKLHLPDSMYYVVLSSVIIGADGQLIYYVFRGIEDGSHLNEWIPDTKKSQRINKKIESFLHDFPKLIPATKDGVNVPCYLAENCNRRIFIKNGIASYVSVEYFY